MKLFSWICLIHFIDFHDSMASIHRLRVTHAHTRLFHIRIRAFLLSPFPFSTPHLLFMVAKEPIKRRKTRAEHQRDFVSLSDRFGVLQT